MGTFLAYDIDAVKFIQTTGNLTSIEKYAINHFIKNLKKNNLWDEIYLLYPYVGVTASSHSYNLKNPSQYQITWNGGLTHNTNGVTGNGTTGYGATGFFIGSLTYNNTALHTYIRSSEATTAAYDLGGFAGTPRLIYGVKVNATIGSSQQYNSTPATGRLDYTNATPVGMWTATRPASNIHKIIKNGVVVASNTGTSAAPANVEIYVRAINNNGTTAANFNPRNCALDCVSNGLSDAEALTFYNIVQEFQTTLGRQI